MYRYIYTNDYFETVSKDCVGTEIINAINNNQTDSAEILKRYLAHTACEIVFRVLNRDFAQHVLMYGKNKTFSENLNLFLKTHDEDYFKKAWQNASVSKEYDVISIVLESSEVPVIDVKFLDRIARQFRNTEVFRNVTEIKGCLTPVSLYEYASHQDYYDRLLFKNYFNEVLDGNNSCFELNDDETDRKPEGYSDAGQHMKYLYANRYCVCFVIKTQIPQIIDYRSLDEHLYSVRKKNMHSFVLPSDLEDEISRYRLHGVFYRNFRDYMTGDMILN